MSRSAIIACLFTIVLFSCPASSAPVAPEPITASMVAQTGGMQPPDASRQEPLCPDPQFGERRNGPESKFCEDLHNKQNKARHESLKKDTDHLLELATQLKEYVDKTNEHTLSLDVIKKAEEVEKLAKKVREKMRG